MKNILYIILFFPAFVFGQKGAGTITGGGGGSTIDSLTTNYIVKASSDSTIENSQIFDDGTSVGIGTATSTAKLSIKNLQEPSRATVVTSQTFDSSTDWTTGTNWSIAAGVASASGASADLTYTGSLTVTSGVLYEVTYTMSSYSAGTFTMKIGGATYTLPSHNVTANVVALIPTTTAGGFRITASSGTANFDNISIVAVSNPATVLLSSQLSSSTTEYEALIRPNSTTNANGGGLRYTTGTETVANGSIALYFNTTGSFNVAQGSRALYSNTTGGSNVAQGYQALTTNTIGQKNVGQGYRALFSNTTGNENTANGYQALFSNTTGGSNTANGNQALNFNTAGAFNTAQGHQSLYSNTTGNFNTAAGPQALYGNTTGSSNIAMGYRAGRYIADGSTANATTGNSSYIGADTKASANGVTNENVFGYATTGEGSNSVVIGNTNVTKTILRVGVGVGTTTPAASSVLDLTSTTKGFLPPRMTTTQRNAISSPATGLQVYNTSTNKFNYYNGSAWMALPDSTYVDGVFWKQNGNSFGAESDFGSNDAFGINIETNGTRRLRFDSGGRLFSGTLTDADISVSDTARFMSTGSGKLTILGNASSNTFLNGSNASLLFQGLANYNVVGNSTFTSGNLATFSSSDSIVFNATNRMYFTAQDINALATGNSTWNIGNVLTMLASDSALYKATNVAEFGLANYRWHINSGFSRFYIGSNIAYQINNSTQAQAFNVGDNTATAMSMAIQGGATYFLFNSTDGAEVLSVGSTAPGATTNHVADNTGKINGGQWTPTITLDNAADTLLATELCQFTRIDSVVTFTIKCTIAIGPGTSAGSFGFMATQPYGYSVDFTDQENDCGGTVSQIQVDKSSAIAMVSNLGIEAETTSNTIWITGNILKYSDVAGALQNSATDFVYPFNRFKFKATGQMVVK